MSSLSSIAKESLKIAAAITLVTAGWSQLLPESAKTTINTNPATIATASLVDEVTGGWFPAPRAVALDQHCQTVRQFPQGDVVPVAAAEAGRTGIWTGTLVDPSDRYGSIDVTVNAATGEITLDKTSMTDSESDPGTVVSIEIPAMDAYDEEDDHKVRTSSTSGDGIEVQPLEIDVPCYETDDRLAVFVFVATEDDPRLVFGGDAVLTGQHDAPTDYAPDYLTGNYSHEIPSQWDEANMKMRNPIDAFVGRLLGDPDLGMLEGDLI